MWVRDNKTKQAICGAQIGAIEEINDASRKVFYDTGTELGDRVKKCIQAQTE